MNPEHGNHYWVSARQEGSVADQEATAPNDEIEQVDVFISYNKAGRAWAEWIAQQVVDAGYTVRLQAWHFRPGSNFVLELQRATIEEKRTIAVLSPSYLASRFTKAEWAAVGSRGCAVSRSDII